MISQVTTIAILRRERLKWKREENGAGMFAEGVAFGFLLAIRLIEELGKLTMERMRNNPHYLSTLYRRGH